MWAAGYVWWGSELLVGSCADGGRLAIWPLIAGNCLWGSSASRRWFVGTVGVCWCVWGWIGWGGIEVGRVGSRVWWWGRLKRRIIWFCASSNRVIRSALERNHRILWLLSSVNRRWFILTGPIWSVWEFSYTRIEPSKKDSEVWLVRCFRAMPTWFQSHCSLSPRADRYSTIDTFWGYQSPQSISAASHRYCPGCSSLPRSQRVGRVRDGSGWSAGGGRWVRDRFRWFRRWSWGAGRSRWIVVGSASSRWRSAFWVDCWSGCRLCRGTRFSGRLFRFRFEVAFFSNPTGWASQ